MLIYPDEYSIAKQLENNVISYAAPIKVKPIGTYENGLYYHESILVSVAWNLNDDVFSKEETWAARKSPINKPSNFNHEQSEIIGHIVQCKAIDTNLNPIDDTIEVDNLPEKYHLLVGSVIYTHWPEAVATIREKVENLIQSIEAGEKYVSMECVFSGFDYALKGEDGTHRILPRNEASAFLTKHLRIYGGKGVYDKYTVGRYLRNITFSGKGYVDKPANPESVIFSKDYLFDFSNAQILKKNPFSKKSGVLTTIAENNMNEVLEKQLSDANKLISDLQDKLSKAGLEKYETKISELTASLEGVNKTVASLKDELKQKDESYAKLESELKTAKVELDTSKSSLDTVNKELETIKAAMDEAEKKAMKEKRKSKLMAGGVKEDEAEATVAKFEELVDDQYGIIEAMMLKLATPATKADDTQLEDALKTAKAEEEVNLSASTEDETKNRREQLAAVFASAFGIKKENE